LQDFLDSGAWGAGEAFRYDMGAWERRPWERGRPRLRKAAIGNPQRVNHPTHSL